MFKGLDKALRVLLRPYFGSSAYKLRGWVQRSWVQDHQERGRYLCITVPPWFWLSDMLRSRGSADTSFGVCVNAFLRFVVIPLVGGESFSFSGYAWVPHYTTSAEVSGWISKRRWEVYLFGYITMLQSKDIQIAGYAQAGGSCLSYSRHLLQYVQNWLGLFDCSRVIRTDHLDYSWSISTWIKANGCGCNSVVLA